MASGKKGKKNKGKTLALSDFLQETPGPVATMPIRKSTMNWADEVEDNHDVYDPRSAKASVVLPTAPKASRDFDDIIDKVPQDPPYIAYLTNLPYDVDEDEIAAFFKNLKISHMRIPKDERPGEAPRLKGFGYVEFEDRESLLNALVIPDTTIKNRRIRIDVASDYDNDKRRSGRMDMNRDRSGRSDMSSFGDWRSGPRQENTDMERRGFSRDRERDDSSGAWREGRSSREPERGGGFTRSDRFREERDQDFSRSRDDKNFMRRDYGDRGSRNGGGFTRGPPPPREEETPNEPRQRPKLVLIPRTKPVENEPEKAVSHAAIFGNAKPVDTSARERQIEERLAKDSEVAPPRRDVSKERKEDRENVGQKEKREKAPETEKKIVEKEKTPSHKEKSDLNGVIDKSQQQKRNGDHEKKDAVKIDSDKHKPETKKREEKKEKIEKEMPKLKKADPPNFVASNKFAYLQTEDSSD
ncbi:eukaryotic translation initiation factor 4B-like [Tribolium madens]|uniref:eukaryotic translation initiation factor 4B-like n=1 Tax=Tribolium madens TaxID=41895 RepID=UPI001CF725FA|nr:eukaryotic translation initiation factor 4B-like [Tribolium madens]